MTEILAPSAEPGNLVSTDQNLRVLEAESKAQRKALMDTVDQIEDRLSSTVETVADKVDATQDMLQAIDKNVREYRWAFVAGAVVLGTVVAKSGSGRREPPPMLPSPKKSIAAGLFSLAVATAAKSVASGIVREVMQQQAAAGPATAAGPSDEPFEA